MKFDLTGYDVDNLLKTLYLKRVSLYNVNILEHNHIIFETDDKNEHKVKKYIKNFKTKKTPNFFKRLPKFMVANLGVLLGLFFGSLFFVFASSFTWKISVFGTKDLQVSDIIEVLKNNGVKTGKINLQSSEEIETILLNNYDRIAQVSVIRQGTHIIINLSEKLVYVKGEFEPIKAQYNGIITKINVVTGTVNVKVGDYVNVGDLLVLPFNVNADGEQIAVKPLAEIEAKIFIIKSNQLNKKEFVLTRTGKQQIVYQYQLFNHNLFKGKSKNKFELFECEFGHEKLSNLVPFSRDKITYFELAPTEIAHNFELEKSTLIQKTTEQAHATKPSNCMVLSEDIKTEIANDTLYAFATITLIGIIN